jgi:DNA-binding MarR family transcriptional regulator
VTVKKTAAARSLTQIVLKVFRLNGCILDAAEFIADPAGITAAQWQVLGAVLQTPKSIADIARDMGLARQSVQRIADILVERKLAAYADNPQHKRAKLFAPTARGHASIARLADRQSQWANDVSKGLGNAELIAFLDVMDELIARIEARDG